MFQKIMDVVYPEIRSEPQMQKLIKDWYHRFVLPATVKEDPDIHYLLTNFLQEKTGVVVVIDRVTPEVIEALGDFPNTFLIEFRTFEKEGKLIHLVNPMHVPSTWKGIGTKADRKRSEEGPEYKRSWDARLEWATPETRQIALKLITRLASELKGVTHKPRFRWYCFYKGREMSKSREVMVVLLGKKTLRLAMRYRPAGFQDPENLTHMVAGFFFPRGNERRVSVTPDNFESVIRVAKSTYEGLAGWFD